LPEVSSYYHLSGLSATGMTDLLRLQNGHAFLSEKTVGKGRVYLLAVPLDEEYSNLPRHAIFVPVFYKQALLSAATSPLYYTVSGNTIIDYTGDRPTGDGIFMIRKRSEDFEFIPEMRSFGNIINILVHDQVTEAGHYDLLSGETFVDGLSFNFDRKESDLECYTDGEIRDLMTAGNLKKAMILKDSEKPVKQVLEEINYGKRLWKLFLILVLVFLAIETLLLRLWK
jgi:hypothetical protein